MTVVASCLVGRDAELARLRSHLAGLRDGRGGAVVVTGEAGMGKSRLVREALSGFRGPVLWGRTGIAGVALRPLVEVALAALAAGARVDDASVAGYAPALGAVLPAAEPPSSMPGPSPLVLAEGLLRLVATTGPTVAVVVEDLHWADADTVAAVEYLLDHSARAPLLLVVTLRTEHAGPGPALAAAVAARRSADLVELGRLNPADAAEMAGRCLDARALPDGLAEFVERHAEGRPFFIEETLAGLLTDATLLSTDAGWRFDVGAATVRVPAGYAAGVADRLATAEPAVGLVLGAAAVLGRQFDVALLGPMTGLDADALTRGLRAGVHMQLLGPAPGEPDRLRFRHALSREAVYEALLPTERATLAGAALQALDTGQSDVPPDVAARLALAAGRRLRAAHLLVAAGRAAAARGALAAATGLLEEAVAQAAGDLDATAAAEEALVETLALAGDAQRALSVGYRLLRTLEAAGAAGGRQVAARLSVSRAAIAAGAMAEAERLVERALGAGQVVDAALRARGEAVAALIALEAGRGADAVAWADAALAGAEAAGEPAAACQALEVLGRLARTRDLGEAGRLFDRAQTVAERHGLRLWRARALHEVATIEFLVSLGVAGLYRARAAAVEAGAAGLVAAVDLHLSALHGVRFESDPALAAGERSVDTSTRLGMRAQAGFAWVCVAQAHAVAARRRDTEAAVVRARELASGAEAEAYLWGQCLALLSLLEEDRTRARAELARSMEYVRSGEPVSVAPYRGVWPLLVTLDDEPGAGAAARAETATADVRVHTAARGLLAYAEAVCAGRHGDRSAAGEAFARGEAEFAQLELPQGYHQLGRRLVAEAALTDGWGEPVAWLAEAHDWFDARGLDRVAAACRALLRRAGVPQRRRGRGDTAVPAALARLGVTSREADVLRMLALGLANADIAARLYVAPRTVKTHVEHLLAKTGFTSRVQLAALAIAEGLGPADRPPAGG